MIAAIPTTIECLKSARGRKVGATVYRTAAGRMLTTTTDGDVWATIDSTGDGGPDGWEVFEPGNVGEVPQMGAATFAASITWKQVEQVVGAVVPASDTESSRYALGGTLIECREGGMMAAVATDGRRMHAAYLQPSSIAGATPEHCVVPADAWRRLATVTRAAVRSLRGLAGRKLTADLQRGGVTIETDGTVVRLVWGQGDLSVVVVTKLIQGRFPRWRDVVEPATAGAPGVVVEADAMAAELAEFSRRHRAAVAAAKASWSEAAAVAKAQRRYHAPFAHDRGVWVSPSGLEGRGCQFAAGGCFSPARVCLDHDYLADALAAVSLFTGTAVVQATDDTSAVAIGDGTEFGERVVVVVMPLAVDA